MTRIGKLKRLALGLGVMVLGILGALPFRHSPGADETPSDRKTADDAMLGKGVALQVPGQAVSTPSQVPDLRPMPPAEKEPEKPAKEEMSESKLGKHFTPPPQLPDEYYPLYRPENRDEAEAGRGVSSDNHDTSDRQPRRTHTIRDGDTLPLLAQRYLGDPQRGGEIMEANRSVLSDPEVLPIGVEIIIPSESAPANQSDIDASSDVEIPKLVPLPPMDSTR
ncbi:MAG: LysM peptidoglycan-binding domain-containing protein [Planctomycetota bacterium]